MLTDVQYVDSAMFVNPFTAEVAGKCHDIAVEIAKRIIPDGPGVLHSAEVTLISGGIMHCAMLYAKGHSHTAATLEKVLKDAYECIRSDYEPKPATVN